MWHCKQWQLFSAEIIPGESFLFFARNWGTVHTYPFFGAAQKASSPQNGPQNELRLVSVWSLWRDCCQRCWFNVLHYLRSYSNILRLDNVKPRGAYIVSFECWHFPSFTCGVCLIRWWIVFCAQVAFMYLDYPPLLVNFSSEELCRSTKLSGWWHEKSVSFA